MSRWEQFKNLEVDKKYTIVGMSEFGFPYSRHITFKGVEYHEYAQYKDAATLRFKVKRKQKSTGTYFYGSKEVLIFENWISVDTEMFREKNSNGMKTSLASFDNSYMAIAKKSVKALPVVAVGPREY